MIKAIITTGDPSGIGPEVSVKAVNNLLDEGFEFVPVLVGDISVIARIFKDSGIKRDLNLWQNKIEPGKIYIEDVRAIKEKKFPKCSDNALTGRASFIYLQEGWNMLAQNKGDCLITAPISKKAWELAGIPYSGHTNALSFFSKEKTFMLMVAREIRVLLATVHIPMKEIWQHLTEENLFLSTKITAEFVTKFFGISRCRIAFCGLNPHAGESGVLGVEEKQIIKPVIKKLRRYGFQTSGPYPADSIFKNIIADNNFDLIVSMYHDQALPVLKTLFFEELVNITVNQSGWIRTSPGHGTAFDIAWKNKANILPMKQAIKTAVEMAKKKWTHS